MRTWIPPFAYFVLILQVVSGAYSPFADRSQIHQGNDVNNNFKVGTFNNYMQERKPLFLDDVGKFDYNNLDDAYESQFPPPPTQKDMSADISYEDGTVDNVISDKSRYSTPDGSYVLPGAGHLETNEIVKDPNSLLKKTSVPTSKSSDDNKKVEINNGLTPIITKQNKHPELDKVVQNAINNLPSAEESPLVPLIKVFNERVQKQSNDEKGNLEDMERKNFLNKLIVLKLANKVQKESIERASQANNFNLYKPEITIQPNENESTQVQNLNEASNENPPCDCEDGCESESQSESGQVSLLDQRNPTEDEVDLTNGSRNPKLLGRVIVMLRKPKIEDSTMKKVRLSAQRGEFDPFKPREDPPLAHIFLGGSTSEYASTNTNPTFHFEENYDRPHRENPLMQENTAPLAVRTISEQLASGMASMGCDGMNESSQEESRVPTFSSTENYQSPKIPDIKRIQYGQPIPKESLLLRHLIEIMKEKAAANALRENQERQLPRFFSSPSFYESSKVAPPPVTKFAIIRPRNQLPQPQLPPLHFPDENSGYEIRHIDDSTTFPHFGQDHDDSDTDSELSSPVQILSQIQKIRGIQDSSQQPSYNSPQDLPLFIRNVLASLGRPIGESNLQPIPTQIIPAQKPAEERPPVLFRGVLAPYVL